MATKRVAKRQQNFIVRFYKETIGELRKVSWPTRKEAISLTYVVIFVMFFMAVILGGLDWLFFQFFRWFFAL